MVSVFAREASRVTYEKQVSTGREIGFSVNTERGIGSREI
jgi:hypothetical protein